MSIEILHPWTALGIPALGRVEFERITYDAGMEIHLKEEAGERRRFYLKFSDLPTAFRITNESMRLATMPILTNEVRATSFFLVENSKFLKWLNSESLDIYKDDPIWHLAILTDEWIDIICNDDPKVIFKV